MPLCPYGSDHTKLIDFSFVLAVRCAVITANHQQALTIETEAVLCIPGNGQGTTILYSGLSTAHNRAQTIETPALAEQAIATAAVVAETEIRCDTGGTRGHRNRYAVTGSTGFANPKLTGERTDPVTAGGCAGIASGW